MNDQLSSLKVYKAEPIMVPDFGGSACVVIVYQHYDFSGWEVAFGEGDYDVAHFVDSGGENDDASSVRVRGLDCKAELF